jgi:hypothetical protein
MVFNGRDPAVGELEQMSVQEQFGLLTQLVRLGPPSAGFRIAPGEPFVLVGRNRSAVPPSAVSVTPVGFGND